MEMVGDAKQLLSVIESQAQEYSNPGTQAGSAGASFTGRRRSSLSAGPCAVGFPTRILALLLHSCDLSTPVRPFETFLGFSKLVVAEFFAQGDEERTLGMEVRWQLAFDRQCTLCVRCWPGAADFFLIFLFGIDMGAEGEPALRPASDQHELWPSWLHRLCCCAAVLHASSNVPSTFGSLHSKYGERMSCCKAHCFIGINGPTAAPGLPSSCLSLLLTHLHTDAF